VPKQVDHQERRQQIADAVCRLAATQGLDAVSLRHVAAEAGVSMGLVQHYFATKDEMLLFTFRTVGERAAQRISTAVAGAEPHPRAALRALLVEMLSLSPESRAAAPMWAAFLARAVVEPRLAEILRDGGPAMIGFVASKIQAAQESGEASASVDPATEAVTLLALVDGLMMHLLIGDVDESAALAALDGQLSRIFSN
jgi:AcrR family transcriptional regulator